MPAWAWEWLELSARWLHVIAGVAWIGTSFYFNWLNDRLEAPEEPGGGVAGELWAVHGGGFYKVSKFDVAPRRLPRTLHWFKWEAYVTWLSGAALLVLIYYLGAEVYLVDPASGLGTRAAVALGIGTLALGWIAYDRLCRSPLERRPVTFGVLGLALLAAVAFALVHALGDRAAYIHVGALIGTLMAANVFFVIIPAHRELVDAVEEGRAPDAAVGRHAAMRSRHNNYLTLPVLFVMISNHYPITYGHRWNWAILMGIFVVGAGVRHYFNLRNQGRAKAWILPAAALGMVALALVSAGWPGRAVPAQPEGAGERVEFREVREVIVARCVTCHSASPAHRLFDAPPAGLAFDRPEEIRAAADRIYETTVATQVMPLGNFTGMTDAERALLAAWIRAGAPLEDDGPSAAGLPSGDVQ